MAYRGPTRFNPLLLQMLFRTPRRLEKDIEIAAQLVEEALRSGGITRANMRAIVLRLAKIHGYPEEPSKLLNDLVRTSLLVGAEPRTSNVSRIVDVVTTFRSPVLFPSWHGKRFLENPTPRAVATGFASNAIVRTFFEELHAIGEVVEINIGDPQLGLIAAKAIRKLASRTQARVGDSLERLALAFEKGKYSKRLYKGLLRPLEILLPGSVERKGTTLIINPGLIIELTRPPLDVERLAKVYCNILRDYGYVIEPPRGPPIPVVVLAKRLSQSLDELLPAIEEEAKINPNIVYEVGPALGGEELRHTISLSWSLISKYCHPGA